MKKILFFIESLSGGGAEKILVNIVKNLDENKFSITVLVVTDTGTYIDEVKKHCNYQFILPNYNSLKTLYQKIKYKIKYKMLYKANPEKVYKRYFPKDQDIEVAFIEGFSTKIIGASANKKSKKLAWVHTDIKKNQYADNYFKNIQDQMKCYEKFDSIICVSQGVSRSIEKKLGLSEKIKIQKNPIDCEEIKKLSQEKVELKKNNETRPLLVTLGRLVNQKGYDRLIAIADLLRNDKVEFELWILGDGEEKEKLQKFIKTARLEDCVKLLGFKKNPYPYLKKADLFVCSSRAEGLSTSITEALILGLPVITTNCAGVEELLGDDSGIIVENSTEALYLGVKNLLASRETLELYGSRAERRSKDFELEKTINEIESYLLK